MDLTSKILLRFQGSATKSLDASLTALADLIITENQSLTDGTGAGKADIAYHDAGTIAGSGAVALDIAGGVTDAFGDTVAITKLKGVIVRNISDDTTAGHSTVATDAVIEFGGTGANGITTFFTVGTSGAYVRAGGAVAAVAADATGYAVTAGSADTIHIKNGSTSPAAYQIMVIGASA